MASKSSERSSPTRKPATPSFGHAAAARARRQSIPCPAESALFLCVSGATLSIYYYAITWSTFRSSCRCIDFTCSVLVCCTRDPLFSSPKTSGLSQRADIYLVPIRAGDLRALSIISLLLHQNAINHRRRVYPPHTHPRLRTGVKFAVSQKLRS